MKKCILIIVTIFFIHSCKEKPSYCEKPYKVKQIKLSTKSHWSEGNEITINNDSLINFITTQICEIKDVNWSTGNRVDGETIELQLIPSNNKKIFIVKRGYGFNDYRIREGTAYFKNDILCDLIVQLSKIPSTTDRPDRSDMSPQR